jgi:hypothetical protein
MNPDFVFALYVFCADYHSGQWSRGYRLLSQITRRYGPHLSDSAWLAIQGNRHTRHERALSTATWEEWQEARSFYRQLKRKYSGKI